VAEAAPAQPLAPGARPVLVAGATGFAGALAAQLLWRHPDFELVAVTGRSEVGRPLAELYPRYRVPLALRAPELEELPQVEAAVVAYPHDIKGQAIYAFVTLNAGEEGSDQLRKDLVQEVRHDIGALAAPEKIHFTPALPKTRSGKIMRRILRKIAEGTGDGFGDISTLADPTIVDALVRGRQ